MLRLLLTANSLQLKPKKQESSEEGLTLLECLIAIVVVVITLIAITPPIFLVTGSRVQQRRAEQSLQLAQAEIDRVRTTVERGTYTTNDLPQVVSGLGAAPVPTALFSETKSTTSSCNSYLGGIVPANQLLQIDTDGDCTPDYLLQSFRTAGQAGTSLPTTGFRMGVRVYAYAPVKQNLDQGGSLSGQPASLKFTTGLGNQKDRPLATLYSAITRNDTIRSVTDYNTLCPSAGSC